MRYWVQLLPVWLMQILAMAKPMTCWLPTRFPNPRFIPRITRIGVSPDTLLDAGALAINIEMAVERQHLRRIAHDQLNCARHGGIGRRQLDPRQAFDQIAVALEPVAGIADQGIKLGARLDVHLGSQ